MRTLKHLALAIAALLPLTACNSGAKDTPVREEPGAVHAIWAVGGIELVVDPNCTGTTATKSNPYINATFETRALGGETLNGTFTIKVGADAKTVGSFKDLSPNPSQKVGPTQLSWVMGDRVETPFAIERNGRHFVTAHIAVWGDESLGVQCTMSQHVDNPDLPQDK